MEVSGTAFSFEISDSWEIIPSEGMVVVSAEPGYLNFRPTFVLREFRIDDFRPDVLASISQANLRGLPETMQGAYAVQVEAIPDGNAGPGPRERRRITALAPMLPPNKDALGLLMIQDLLVVGEAVAELTLTVPVMSWQPDGLIQQTLNTLRPLPRPGLPETVVQVPNAELDQWATARDGAPREKVAVQGHLPLALLGKVFALSITAMSELKDLAPSRFFGRKVRQPALRDELAAAGIVDADGKPTEVGTSLLDIIQHGNAWSLEVSGLMEDARSIEGWGVEDASLLFVGPSPKDPIDGMGFVGYCSTDDLPRVLLMWSGTQPGWQMSFRLPELSAREVAGRLIDVPISYQLDDDAAEFESQPWRCFSYSDVTGKEGVTWVTTPDRGAALCTQGAEHDHWVLTSFDRQPLWAYLAAAAMTISYGENDGL